VSAIAARLKPARRLIIESPIAGPLITLFIVFVLFSLFVPHFLTIRTILGIVNAATLTATITIGITLLMIAGEIDLSVGASMAMGAYLYGMHTVEGGNPLWALFLALFVTGLMGALNGFIRIRTRIPSFIVTLAMLYIYRGAIWLYAQGQMFQTIEEVPIYAVFNGCLPFIADVVKGANFRTATLWLIGLVILFQYILTRTRFGNCIFATGGNESAAAAQGVNVGLTKLKVFVISAALAGFSGVLMLSQFRTVRIGTGAGQEFKAISAAVVGGTLLGGGSGSIVGALLGGLIVSTLRTGVVLADLIPADNFPAIVGVTIVAAAIFNDWIRKRS